MSDTNDLIIQILKDHKDHINGRLDRFGEDLRDHETTENHRLAKIDSHLEEYNRSLAIHIAGVQTNKAGIEINRKELQEYKARGEKNEEYIKQNLSLIESHTSKLSDLHAKNYESIQKNKEDIDKINLPIEAKEYLYKKYMKIGGALSLLLGIAALVLKLMGKY